MSDRMSRSQIDKLGERLAASDEVSADDLALLQRVREEHDAAMLDVATRLYLRYGLQPATRLKTIGTIVDKLKRESIRLSQMQDIAGVRLVGDMNRAEQDELVERIVGVFPESRVIDRRATPSHGYRAVHVVVEVNRRFVEVQVRTELQHAWAQVLERVADEFGRGIRYGDARKLSQSLVSWLGDFQRYSQEIADQEVITLEVLELETKVGPGVEDRLARLHERLAELKQMNIAYLRSMLERLDVGEWRP